MHERFRKISKDFFHQRAGTSEPGDPPYPCDGQVPRRQLRSHAGLCPITSCDWYSVGQQEVHIYEGPVVCP